MSVRSTPLRKGWRLPIRWKMQLIGLLCAGHRRSGRAVRRTDAWHPSAWRCRVDPERCGSTNVPPCARMPAPRTILGNGALPSATNRSPKHGPTAAHPRSSKRWRRRTNLLLKLRVRHRKLAQRSRCIYVPPSAVGRTDPGMPGLALGHGVLHGVADAAGRLVARVEVHAKCSCGCARLAR